MVQMIEQRERPGPRHLVHDQREHRLRARRRRQRVGRVVKRIDKRDRSRGQRRTGVADRRHPARAIGAKVDAKRCAYAGRRSIGKIVAGAGHIAVAGKARRRRQQIVLVNRIVPAVPTDGMSSWRG